jgi:hypothetical protein
MKDIITLIGFGVGLIFIAKMFKKGTDIAKMFKEGTDKRDKNKYLNHISPPPSNKSFRLNPVPIGCMED